MIETRDARDMAGVRIGLLGPFDVRLPDGTVHIPAGRQRTLLAELALAAGRTVQVESLIDSVWETTPPRNPRTGIQNLVRRLRHLLGPAIVCTETSGYRLGVDPEQVDVARFLRLSRAASATHRSDPSTRRTLLTEALSLWRGQPLAGIESTVLERDHASFLVERYLTAVEQRIDLDLEHRQGGIAEVIAELRELTSAYPLRESLWARLLTALSYAGRPAEALESYDRIRNHLVETLGSDPSDELQDLFQRILDNGRDSSGSGQDSRPEPDQDGRSGTPQPDPPLPRPRQLPPAPVEFVGRHHELGVLDDILSAPAPDGGSSGAREGSPHGDDPRPLALVVLHGAGGVGKTALALRWAHRAGDRFADGQLYVNLEGFGPDAPVEPSVALGGMLRALGVSEDRIPTTNAESSALFRTVTAGTRILLVLDNARDTDQVRPLLPSWGTVLVTSRNRLEGLAVTEGAYGQQVPELTVEESEALITTGLGAGRAHREPEAVAELVRRCCGLPLALRLLMQLAARHPETALDDFARELRARDDRLDLLARDDARSDPRAVFSWSYDSLDPEAAHAFRTVALHLGGDIGLRPAAALLGCDSTRARALLDRLTSVHLVEESRRGRYRMHDLLRLYALERGRHEDAEPDRDRALRRLVEWYAETARVAWELLPGSLPSSQRKPGPAPSPQVADWFRTSADGLRWFDEEQDALVAAVRTAAGDHGCPEAGWALASLLSDYFELRHQPEAYIAMARAGLDCARQTDDPTAIYSAAHTLGVACIRTTRYQEAPEHLRVALDAARQLDDEAKVTTCWTALGMASSHTGDYATAVEHHGQAVAAARRSSDPTLVGTTALNLGLTQIGQGTYAESVATTTEALRVFRECGATFQAGYALGNLTDAYTRLGNLDAARECAEQAEGILRERDHKSGLGELLKLVGRLELRAGNRPAARKALERATELLSTDDPHIREVTAMLDEC